MRYTVIASVVVEKTAYRFDKPFDYSVPEELKSTCKPGCRVMVPFGRGNNKRQGLVLSVTSDDVFTEKQVKNVISVIDKKPLLNNELLGLVKWLKKRTFCTYYDAVKTLIPFGLNLKIIPVLRYNNDASAALIASLSADANAVVTYLRKKGGFAEKTAVERALGLSEDAKCFDELKEKGVILMGGCYAKTVY